MQFAKREAQEMVDARKRASSTGERASARREMPLHFFEFAACLRKAWRFNENCDPMLRMYWRESASLATRDIQPNADFI